jgi:hypothetical protein
LTLQHDMTTLSALSNIAHRSPARSVHANIVQEIVMNLRKLIERHLAGWSLLLLFSLTVIAQGLTGQISGTIRDANGARVPGVTVLV